MHGLSSGTTSSRVRSLLSRGFILWLLLNGSLPHQAEAQEIFFDDFESGGIDAWSRSFNADCTLVLSQVSNCDFNLGLEDWGDPTQTDLRIVDDNSDGGPGQALEMVVEPFSSIGQCFPKLFEGEAVMTNSVDIKVVSGEVTNCGASVSIFTDASCSMQVGSLTLSPAPTSSEWEYVGLGGFFASSQVNSMRIRFWCTGSAVLRIDEFIITPLTVMTP
ncbi:MAG: hypothetical protein AAGC60_01195 [Acidobacteriota bacterium]